MEIDSLPPPGARGAPKATRPPMHLELPSSTDTHTLKSTMMDIDHTPTSLELFQKVTTMVPSIIKDDKSDDKMKDVIAPLVMDLKGAFDTDACARLKLDEMFGNWLSYPETKVMLNSLIRDAGKGDAIAMVKMAVETRKKTEEKIKRAHKLKGVRGRLAIAPVTRFMDDIRNLTIGGEPPRSPSRKVLKMPMKEKGGESMVTMDLGAAKVGVDRKDGMSYFRNKLGGREVVKGVENGVMEDVVMEKKDSHMNGGDDVKQENKIDGVEQVGQEKKVASGADNDQNMSGGEGQEKIYQTMLPNRKPPNPQASRHGVGRKLKEIPRFYFPGGRNVLERERQEVEHARKFFETHREMHGRDGVTKEEFSQLVVEVVGLPSFMSTIVFDRATASGPVTDAPQAPQNLPNGVAHNAQAGEENANAEVENAVEEAVADPAEIDPPLLTETQFFDYYASKLRHKTKHERLFNVLVGDENRNYVVPEDFKPMVSALLVYHPGLLFLKATPEFQQRYCETVIQRIYYGCTKKHNSCLSLSDIKRSGLVDTLMQVDEDDDINHERRFFSYEHFYVLYCRFWELDTDHDLMIDRDDLMRYSTHALSYRIVDRVFGGFGRPLDCRQMEEGKMTYTDFVWFCISEEDKASDTAIDYWFRCIDLDGDGLITMYDIEYFYREQMHRIECIGAEIMTLPNMISNLFDMVKGKKSGPPTIRRKDLKDSGLATNFFNTLFNVNKLFHLENRDPVVIRQEHSTPDLRDWDRFALNEYMRLSNEEEIDDMDPFDEMQPEVIIPLIGEAPF
eukprot:Plantae.Rhodophyta-Hildenbrandia_rubra.ctg13905.p1 GENE.Plantae.Rhodophyta-Hildenbrandia_rubra.ctg13905~~Plantae.Rhodophyta-Hildenbrandia_rubra.ctg13905.p1  ORF type:complete len:789 (-),score=178.43 Plantae.Rhodophyta-Hildenbrandia_rubra.ctg13905:537-2903(-)